MYNNNQINVALLLWVVDVDVHSSLLWLLLDLDLALVTNLVPSYVGATNERSLSRIFCRRRIASATNQGNENLNASLAILASMHQKIRQPQLTENKSITTLSILYLFVQNRNNNMTIITRSLLVFLFLVPSVASFVEIVPRVSLLNLAMGDTAHQDHVIPNDKLPDVAQARRERMMGTIQDDNSEDNDERSQQEQKKQKRRDRTVEKTHPHLAQMSKLLDQQIMQDVPIDPNC